MDKKAVYALLYSSAWALNIFFNKMALNAGNPAFELTVQTTAISAALMLAYILARKRGVLAALRIGRPLGVLTLSCLAIAAATLTSGFGLKFSTSVNYGFLIKSTLIWIAILAAIFLKERMTARKAALILAFGAGTYLVSTAGASLVPKPGDILILISAICFSVATVIQKPLTKILDSETVSLGSLIVPAAALAVLSPLLGTAADLLSVRSFAAVFLTSVFCTLTVIFFVRGLAVSSASYMAMMSMTVPVMTSALGILFLGEGMGVPQILGAAITIVAGFLAHKAGI